MIEDSYENGQNSLSYNSQSYFVCDNDQIVKESSDLITPDSINNQLIDLSYLSIQNYNFISQEKNPELFLLETDIINQVFQKSYDYLSGLPSDPGLDFKLQLVFGNSFNSEIAEELIQNFANNDFDSLSPIRIVSSDTINNARGAYDTVHDRIYLAEDFIRANQNSLEEIVGVVLEEIGHFIDSRINTTDALGDEGELFSSLVRDIELSASTIAKIKAEDDTAIVVVDGKKILIEQSVNNADNTIANARNLGNLSNIQTIKDFVGTSDPNDFYRISISNPSTLNLNLSQLNADANVQLIQDFNNNGVVDPKEILALSQNKGRTAESLNLPLLSGTYYVRVFPGVTNANSKYTLSLSASSLGVPNYIDSSLVQSYFGTNVTRTFYNNIGNGASVYQSQLGQFLMHGAIADYYTNTYFKNPDSKNGLFGIYSGLGLPTSSIYVQADGSQVMEFEGGNLTNRNGIITPFYNQKNGDRFDLVGLGAPDGNESQWKNDYSWYNRKSVGTPTGSVRRINGGWVQEFTGSSDGNSIFLLKDGQTVLGGTENYTDNYGRSIPRPRGGPYRVQGGILNAYLSVGGYERQNNGLGFPTLSTERSDFKGYKTYHEFENGFIGITYDGKTVIQDWQGRPIAPIGKWVAEYYNNPDLKGNPISLVKTFGNDNLNGKPVFSRIEDSINNDWGAGGPGNGIGNDNFSVRWTGNFNFEAATYRFNASMDDGMRLWIDNSLIIDTWNGRNAVDYTNKSLITAGIHTIKVEYREFGGLALAKVNWEKVIPWKAEYFNNRDLTGNVVFAETFGDAKEGLSKNWGWGSPNSNVNSDNFSARFTSQRYLEAGLYKVVTGSDDGIRVWIGNQRVIDRWVNQAANYSDYFYSNGGIYPIKVEYFEGGGAAGINLNLEKASKFQENIAPDEWNATIFNWDASQGKPPQNFFDGGYNNPRTIATVNLGSGTLSNGKKGISFNWGANSVKGDSRLPYDNFVIRAYTVADFDGKEYKFQARGDDGFQLLAKQHGTNQWFYITPQNQWQEAYGGAKEFKFTLPSGRYDLHFHMFEGAGDANFDLSWEKVNNYAPASNITYVNFSGRVMPTIGVALRNSPNLNDKVSGLAYAYNQILKFDAWTRGETAIDSKLGTPDDRWFKIAGTNYWVPSAYIDGNPPSSSSGGSSGGGTANLNLPVMTVEQFNNWRNLSEYTSRNPFPFKGQNCTWYAHGRLLQLGYSKSALDTMLGNAGTWDERAGRGAFVSSSPKAGAIAVWEAWVNGAGSVGHVAVVERVNADGTILISESNWANKAYNTRTISANGLKFVIVPLDSISGGNNNSGGGTGNTNSGSSNSNSGGNTNNNSSGGNFGSTSKTINFALYNQSIWGEGQGFSLGRGFSNEIGKEWDFGLGKISAKAGYSFEASISGGNFNVDFPALFDLSWQLNAVEKSVAVNFSNKLISNVKMETAFGIFFNAKTNASATLSTNNLLGSHSLGLEVSGGLDSGSLLSAYGFPLSLDLDLRAKTDRFDQGTRLKAEDVAFEAIDIVNTLAIIPQTKATGELMKNAGIGLKLGANIKQESFFDIKGFEFDYDGIKNGNELVINPNATENFKIILPQGFKAGQEFKFTPTVKPIVDFWTQFSVSGKAEGSFDFYKLGNNLTNKYVLPEWVKKPINEALPKISYKEEKATGYTQPWLWKKFNPYANISQKLNDISIKIG